MRTGTYIVPTHHWYIERTVWLIAGVVLLSSTALALLRDGGATPILTNGNAQLSCADTPSGLASPNHTCSIAR